MADATKQPIDPGVLARVTNAFKVLTGKKTAVDPQATVWFGPLTPPEPALTGEQRSEVAGRQFDFPSGYNTRIKPRSGETVTFEQMRALADNCDILRLVIETRKDQISKMKFSVKPMKEGVDPTPRCKEIEDFLRFPDGENNWSDWLRQLLEEMLVTDAATIYPWLLNGGKPFRFELVDGSTIKRVIDARGRTPVAPYPAYQQVLKGIPAVDYTIDELVYSPRNKRIHKVYGYSPVEQIIMTINIAMRRSLHQLQFYTEGSTPDLLFQVPADWNMQQIKEFNDWWQDSLAGNTATRRKAQFIPHGVTPVNTKEGLLKDPYDEWLARIICYAFSVSSQHFIKENNRSTAETAQQLALEEGLMPVMQWVKATVDKLIWRYFKDADLEFIWDDQDAIDPAEQAKMDDVNVRNGTASINEIRAKRGDPPIDGGDVMMSLTAMGYVPILQATLPEPDPAGAQLGPNGQPVAPPTTQGSTEVTSGQPKQKVGKIRKAALKKVPQINRESPARVKILNTTKKKLAKFFKEQAKALAQSVMNKVAKSDEDVVDSMDWAPWSEIQDLLGTQLVLSASLGAKDAFAQIDGTDTDMLKVANQDAIDYAENRAAELVGKTIDADGNVVDNPDASYSIEDATREMIRGDVTQAMQDGLSNDELAAMLEENYAFSEARAETIARTETANADAQGNLAVYKESGVVAQKQWIVGAGCCDECQALDGEVVDLDDNFSTGDDAPPAHPNCRCDYLPLLDEPTNDTNEE